MCITVCSEPVLLPELHYYSMCCSMVDRNAKAFAPIMATFCQDADITMGNDFATHIQ